ncbi:ABC transporter ATP-binding protein [bacterium]|nr:ABC transporter ATP-binding protein [bacterium]
MKTYLRFLKNALHYKGRLVIGIIGIIGVNLFNFASIGAVIPLVDKVISKKDVKLPQSVYDILPISITNYLDIFVDKINAIPAKDLFINLAIFLFIGIVLKSFFGYIMKVSMESVAQNVMRDFTTKMYSHIQELPVEYFDKMRTGELISRLTNDVNLVQASLSARFTDNIAQVTQIPGLIFALLLLNWKMALFAGIFLPLILGPIALIGKYLQKLSKKTQEKIADITSILQETIAGIRIVRAFNMEKYETDRFYYQTTKYCKLRIKAIVRSALVSPLTEIVGVSCLIIVASMLLMPVIEGNENTGNVVGFVAALLIMIKPLRCIGKINNIIRRSMAAIVRIYALLDTEPSIKEVPGAIDMGPVRDEMKFNNVYFHYDINEPPVINDLSFSIKSGEMVAIVGPSGAGKTTLVNLIPRFYEVTGGEITVDGEDIRDMTFKSLRSQIGIVTQETFLFNDSVKNNIAYGRSDILIEQIVEAAKAANAHDFISDMPEGYNTIIGERGVRLSGGQRQRLAIARAILKNPNILIFDEATSALDTESEKLVQEAIDRLVENRTVFAIAHRLSTIQHADKILVLSDGKLVQVGNHETLLKDEGGLYKRLHDMQFGNTNNPRDVKLFEFIKKKYLDPKKNK